MRLLMIFGLVVAGGLALGFAPVEAKFFGVEGDRFARLVYGGTIAFVLLGSIVGQYQGRVREALADLALWLVLLLTLVAVYSYRFELATLAARMVSELMPGAIVEGRGGEVTITRRLDGNFVVRMQANGVTLPFVFDTGASSVVIRAEDAERVGISVDALIFTIPISTANGRALAAETEIARLSVGRISLLHVPTLVTKAGTLNENLLGMSFLDKLASFTVAGDRLILKGR